MPRFGYARVSSSTLDLEILKLRLSAAGRKVLHAETASGASREDRAELEDVPEFPREGDELFVQRQDRHGRFTLDELNLVHELDAKGASLRVLEPEVTTLGDLGCLVVTVLGMVVDMKLKFICDRQYPGIDAVKKKGVDKVRQKQVDEEKTRQLAAEEVPTAQIALTSRNHECRSIAP